MLCTPPVLGKCLFHVADRIAPQRTGIGEKLTRVHVRLCRCSAIHGCNFVGNIRNRDFHWLYPEIEKLPSTAESTESQLVTAGPYLAIRHPVSTAARPQGAPPGDHCCVPILVKSQAIPCKSRLALTSWVHSEPGNITLKEY